MEFQKKPIIEGIILILSCQKHKDTRLKEFRLKNNEYDNWKVIYIIGDLFLESDYNLDGNLMTIKCEDSYIHLLKKLVLAIKYVNEIYDIKQGILRSGDDVVFNESNLVSFLKMNKPDFIGSSPTRCSLINPSLSDLKITRHDYFMIEYYLKHLEDFLNPQHNLNGVNILKYTKRPEIKIGPWGALYYISNKCCNFLVSTMENINYDIFHFDEFTQSYPYTIEDCAVSFILYFNGISFYNNNFFISDNDFSNFNNILAVATNKYK